MHTKHEVVVDPHVQLGAKSSPMSEHQVQTKDLPRSLTQEAEHGITPCVIGFLQPDQPSLLGSGVLVAVGGKRAILTADHVAERLKQEGRIDLISFGGTTPRVPVIVAAQFLFVRVGPGRGGRAGPDLAVILFKDEALASGLAAKQSFVNLDRRKAEALSPQADLRDGFWLTVGYVDEFTVRGPGDTPGSTKSGFGLLISLGGPKEIEGAGEFDYFECPVEYIPGQPTPKNFGGMSGGGMWRVPFTEDSEGKFAPLPPIFSGVVFFQDTNDTGTTLRAHAVRSVYEQAYRAIAGDKA